MEEGKHNEEEDYHEAELIAKGIYENFNDFVIRDGVQKDDFLKDNPMYVTTEELASCFKNVGFAITDEEVQALMKNHRADKTDYLLIDDLLFNVYTWGSTKAADNAFDKHIDQNIHYLRDKGKQNQKQSSAQKPKLKIKGSTGGKSSIKNVEPKVRLEEKPKKYIPNKSNHYLKLAEQKKADEERALALNIEKCKKELEFDCLHKMSEAWEIAKLLNIPISFVAMKGSDNTMTINFIQYVDADDEGEGEDDADHKMGNKKEIKEEISIDRFMREYWVVLKRIYEKIDKTDNINTPENWFKSMGSAKINFAQLESSLQKNQKFQKSGGMVQDGSLLNKNLKGNYTSDNISSYSLNRINKAQRQEELKNVLKETMSLTTKLKDQLKILEKNGVCGTNMK